MRFFLVSYISLFFPDHDDLHLLNATYLSPEEEVNENHHHQQPATTDDQYTEPKGSSGD